jgi:hypothetical protein
MEVKVGVAGARDWSCLVLKHRNFQSFKHKYSLNVGTKSFLQQRGCWLIKAVYCTFLTESHIEQPYHN